MGRFSLSQNGGALFVRLAQHAYFSLSYVVCSS